MSRRTASRLALAVSAVALFVALGGPASAAKLINGGTIKAKSITAKQLANGTVALGNISGAARKGLRAGAPGATGPKGAAGAIGPVGELSVQDALHRRLGVFAGFSSSIYPMVRLDSGAILAYDNNSANNYPYLPSGPGVIYYKTSGCTGQGYTPVPNPTQLGIIPASPPVPGSPVWVARTGTIVSFNSLSQRNSGGCSNSSTSASQVIPADPAGAVPTIQKPVYLVPKS